MRYIIVGGSGFVGTELINELSAEQRKQVVVLDIVSPSADVIYERQDIREELNFKFMPDDVVIQLAANQYHHKVPRKNRQKFFESVNTKGTENILKKMLADGAKNMIFFSTDMVYGKPQYIPVDTKHPKNPFGYYGKSKMKAEKICEEYRAKGINITIFRPRMIVGKGRLGILIKLFKLIELNLPVPMIGSGNNCYQMISVNDCAQAILKAIKHNFPNVAYNLGSYNPPKVKELLKDVIKQNHSKSLLIQTPGKLVKLCLKILGSIGLEIMYKEQYMIADENYLIDISQTEKDLDWHPQFDDTSMLKAAFDEYSKKVEKNKHK